MAALLCLGIKSITTTSSVHFTIANRGFRITRAARMLSIIVRAWASIAAITLLMSSGNILAPLRY